MIFITGYPRSGTTLIANKISNYEGIYLGPESNYYRKFYNRFRFTNKQFVNQAVSDKRLKDFGLKADEIAIVAKDSNYDKNLFLKKFLEKCSTKKGSGKNLIVEKSPAHILYYERILSSYPDSKFIFITRDPRDVISSNLNVDWIHSNIVKHAITINIYFDFYLSLRNKYPSNVLLVRYEDFVLDNKKTINGILEFISPQNILKKKSGELNNTVPEWELKWKVEALKEVDVSKLYRWKKQKQSRIESVVEAILGDYIDHMHYEHAEAARLSKSDLLAHKAYSLKLYKSILLLRRFLFP